MKLISLFLVATFGMSTLAMDNENLAPAGKVICSFSSGANTSFELINVRGLNKEYTGQHEVGDLRILGTFWAKGYRLNLSLISVDHLGEPVQSLSSLNTQLAPGNFVQIATQYKGTPVEIYCYFINKPE